MPCVQTDRRALAEARERRDQQALLPSADQSRCASSISLSDLVIHTARRRPFSQLSRRMPATWRPLPAPVPSPSIQPRRKRTALLRIVGRGRDDIEGLVDHPRSGEISGMGFAGIDDAFELRVGEQASVTTLAGKCGR